MNLIVRHPLLQKQRLMFRAPTLLKSGALLLNGQSVKRINGRYSVQNDAGDDIVVEIKRNFLDPIPVLKIGEESIQLARSLTWYEYAWIGIPILLIFAGGAIGAGIGFYATYTSSFIFRGERSLRAKYILTGLISLSALITVLLLATLFQLLLMNSKT
jgi:hypothetical protein